MTLTTEHIKSRDWSATAALIVTLTAARNSRLLACPVDASAGRVAERSTGEPELFGELFGEATARATESTGALQRSSLPKVLRASKPEARKKAKSSKPTNAAPYLESIPHAYRMVQGIKINY